MASQESKYSAFARLKQDYICLKKDPIPYIEAEPVPSNILEWYYVVRGPENTPYEGGYYLGKLVFPREYPFKPPSIYMLTPNGRFETRMRLCLSISDYHPEDWNPAWNVSTILTGLLSFMLDKSPTVGSIECSDHKRKALATKSLTTNLHDSNFCDLFPELVKKIKNELDGKKSKEAPTSTSTSSRKRESQSELYLSDYDSDSFSD